MSKLTHMRFLLILMVLVLASLACNLPARGTEAPSPVSPMTTDQIEQFENQMEETLSNPGPSGEVTLNITQEQLSAYLAAEMASQGGDVLSDPRVVLTNGQMEVHGDVNQAGITANTRIVLQPRVEADGSPKLDVQSIELGPFPVPNSLKDRVQVLTNDMLTRYLSSTSAQFKVNDVVITEGQMTITGTQQ